MTFHDMRTDWRRLTQSHGDDSEATGVTTIGKAELTVDQLMAWVTQNVCIAVRSADRAVVEQAHRAAEAIADQRPVYGRTTGVGSNRDVVVERTVDQDLRLLRSHATGSGDRLPRKTVRAAMLIRLNQLLRGGSGMHPDIVDAMVAALNDDDLPVVHAYGAIGTGDLNGFAEIGLALMGELPLESGQMHAYWQPRRGDALAFISTNAMTAAVGCLALSAGRNWLAHCEMTGCLSLMAVRGSQESLAAAVHEARPQPGQIVVARRLRSLLAGQAWQAARIQDSYGFRAMPQVLGALHAALADLAGVLEIELNAASENPLVSAAEHDVFHNGNFHALPIALACDHTKLALFSATQLTACRLTNLSDPTMTALAPFLAELPAGSSGTMLLEYNAAAALARLRTMATPATLGSVVISRGTEDHASFASQAVEQLFSCISDAACVLACELLGATRAIMQSRPGQTLAASTPLGAYFVRLRQCVHDSMADRPLGEDIAQTLLFLQQPLIADTGTSHD